MNDCTDTTTSSQNVTNLLLNLSSATLSFNDLDSFLKNVLGEIGETLGVHRTYIYSINEKNSKVLLEWEDPSLPQFQEVDNALMLQALYEDGMYESFKAGNP